MEKKIKSALNEQNTPPRTNEEAANALENMTKEAEVISGYAAQKNDTALFSVGQQIGTTYWPRKRNIINITEVGDQPEEIRAFSDVRLPYID